MAVRNIVQLGDPLLREIAEPVPLEDIGSAETQSLVRDLRDTLHEFQRIHLTGRGIAAPQIGVCRQVVCIDYPEASLVLINPVITERSDEMFGVWDSCFSYWGMVFLVPRHRLITVEYLDTDGVRQSLVAEGALSELLQHEIEHLHGQAAIDLLIPAGTIMTQQQFVQLQEKGLCL